MADIKKYLDQAGVEYLWKKLSLEDYPNNEMLIAVINALDESKVDAVEGKQLSTEDYTTEEKEKLSNLENYTLPIASTDTLGGVKIGDNLEITEEGVLNAQDTSNVYYGTTEPTDDGIVMWINPEGDEDEVILTTTNTVEYEPTGDYNPATKKYVDEITMNNVNIVSLEVTDEIWNELITNKQVSLNLTAEQAVEAAQADVIDIIGVWLGDYEYGHHYFIKTQQFDESDCMYVYRPYYNNLTTYNLYLDVRPDYQSANIYILETLIYTQEEIDNKLDTMFVDLQPVEEIQ